MGSLAQAAVAHYRQFRAPPARRGRGCSRSSRTRPPACSAAWPTARWSRCRPTVTVMNGLNCGTPSAIAWPYLRGRRRRRDRRHRRRGARGGRRPRGSRDPAGPSGAAGAGRAARQRWPARTRPRGDATSEFTPRTPAAAAGRRLHLHRGPAQLIQCCPNDARSCAFRASCALGGLPTTRTAHDQAQYPRYAIPGASSCVVCGDIHR